MSRRKVGFFGGTFDPIHFGHLNLAVNILEKQGLDQVLFCPANYSPEKKENLPHASREARFEMVELAIESISAFSLLDLELNREGPSYTVDTIRTLISSHPDWDISLIIAEDVLEGLAQWKEVEALFEIAPPIIGTRTHNKLPQLPPKIEQAVRTGSCLIPQMDICSTQIRQRLNQKKICDHLLPSKVLDYIRAKGIY